MAATEKPKFDKGVHPLGTEEQQAKYLRRAVETSAGFVAGWLNWGFYDHPGANDCSELTGLLRVDGTAKAWGKTFQQLSARYFGHATFPAPTAVGPGPRWTGMPALPTPPLEMNFANNISRLFWTISLGINDGRSRSSQVPHRG